MKNVLNNKMYKSLSNNLNKQALIKCDVTQFLVLKNILAYFKFFGKTKIIEKCILYVFFKYHVKRLTRQYCISLSASLLLAF